MDALPAPRAVVIEMLKLPFAPLTANCGGAGGAVKAPAFASTLVSGVVPVCAYRDCSARWMPVSVSRKALFPFAAELIWAKLTLSAIAGPCCEQRAGEQAAILEREPGIGGGAVGKAHAKALILSPGASVVAFPVFRSQRKRRQLDLVCAGLLRVSIISCHHHGYGHRSLTQGIDTDSSQHG